MRYLVFALFLYSLIGIAYAGPNDKWVYIGPKIDAVTLVVVAALLVCGYMIFRGCKRARKRARR
ncbi:MAG: hypothetical protein HYW23_01835 [Candidatus Aenigmarchaeota archaeon]|nr:hypothetical protein [Candidatus Aenigmarchaeota archaeon]